MYMPINLSLPRGSPMMTVLSAVLSGWTAVQGVVLQVSEYQRWLFAGSFWKNLVSSSTTPL